MRTRKIKGDGYGELGPCDGYHTGNVSSDCPNVSGELRDDGARLCPDCYARRQRYEAFLARQASATFNDVTIGDADNGILAIRAGNIDRAVQADEVLGLDGVVTRHRGGGRQTIVVEAWRDCASTVERLGYLEELLVAFGSAKAALVYTGDDGTKVWADCLVASAREDESSGPYAKFTITFVRAAARAATAD